MTADRQHPGANTASTDGGKVLMDTSEADHYFAMMPKSVRDYMLIESPVLYSPLQVLQLVRGYGAERTLEILKEENAEAAEKAFPGITTFKKEENKP